MPYNTSPRAAAGDLSSSRPLPPLIQPPSSTGIKILRPEKIRRRYRRNQGHLPRSSPGGVSHEVTDPSVSCTLHGSSLSTYINAHTHGLVYRVSTQTVCSIRGRGRGDRKLTFGGGAEFPPDETVVGAGLAMPRARRVSPGGGASRLIPPPPFLLEVSPGGGARARPPELPPPADFLGREDV